MNAASSIALLLAAGALCAWAFHTDASGNHSVAAAAPSPGSRPEAAVTVKSSRPDAESLRARSLARWEAICRRDWIAAYDFQTQEQKQLPLAKYLQGKDHHEYANPTVEEVIEVDAGNGYLWVRVLWTPKHPELKRVKLEPGQSLTEEIRMIESWRWEGDEWGYVRAQRDDEFFRDHPHLEKR